MHKSDYEIFTSDPERKRLLEQEKFILEATESLARVIEKLGISKVELARRLGKTPAFVTQVLAGGRNMTMRTLADFLFVLGHKALIREVSISEQRASLASNNFFSLSVDQRIITTSISESSVSILEKVG